MRRDGGAGETNNRGQGEKARGEQTQRHNVDWAVITGRRLRGRVVVDFNLINVTLDMEQEGSYNFYP